ncbi:4a-hydroxytetrahydrobiopterin dehydratase [Modestobacter muralis]|uniref:Putative pterin-4-alpha-carbinolamine dehydratase n=1 Tax=Modestobacter muralis TaxID=1608614 RepID=A0A6P0ETL4_9ACTN|nr:4a-hydroxytetrahydrobiopterin dehydratase [Modestobacter muralis]NEK94992.1 4a-hydroxytetrahydrobiopterin dehydratase [Modestobacter muralis]NEN51880.1 4a-hydroxytetrahydrobiopterin dehydratase [Modestobacter muralis]
MARTPLTPEDLADALTELHDWTGDVHGIHRRTQGIDFRAAAAHVLALADVADALDHHPDVEISYGTLTVHLLTHSVDAVTELDVEFARRADELLAAQSVGLDGA